MSELLTRGKATLIAAYVSWKAAVEGFGYLRGTVIWGLIWFVVLNLPKPAEMKIGEGLSD